MSEIKQAPIKVTRTYRDFESIASDMACAMERDDEELSIINFPKITLIVEGTVDVEDE